MSALPKFYVAIGASAGGLEAIEEFFAHMDAPSGLAFVVIQHLSPDYKSLMVEILSKRTPMPVHRAEDNMMVLPDHVYLIPPKKNLTIFHGRLLLIDQDHSKGINLPIDVFLQSLAEDQGEKAIAVILSGTGSDGMRGVRMVKEKGGMVMVQNEETARFDGMPRAAISTGLADFVLPPLEMPKQLGIFINRPIPVHTNAGSSLVSDEDSLSRIFALLRERFKVDFTYYKPSTITRRIERRMTVTQTETLSEYLRHLIDFPSEISTLFRELLIGVTSFFRDQGTFDRLESDVLQELVERSTGNALRFWVAACSTGEEAYSLAITVKECLARLSVKRDVKIFATDIDRDAIHFAATGTYPESVAADIPARLLAKYFHKKDGAFQIARSIREMVVFAQHNLIKDPPFTNIDLVSCRNILIYLQPNLQRKVLEGANFSLAAGGILVLGTSETTGDASDYFELIDPKFKIYQSRGRIKIADHHQTAFATDTRARTLKDSYATARRSIQTQENDRVLERLFESITGDLLPLAVVVDEHLEPVHIVGNTEGFFKIPAGRPSNDITKMAAKELSIPLATGIQKAFRKNTEQRYSNIRVTTLGNEHYADLIIRPLPKRAGQNPLVGVLFVTPRNGAVERDFDSGATTFDMAKEMEQRLHDLEQELQFSNENLQATIEELETSNEELQATNEELLASNEELQSTNEELQSTNEELYSVNAEYQAKIMELTELHNDMNNLLTATRIGEMILDENLEIRRFSPHVAQIFRILDSDIGRPIGHISHCLVDVDPTTIIQKVGTSGKMTAREVETNDDRWFLMRVVPYEIGPNAFAGTVVSFTDITEVKLSSLALAHSQRRLAAVADNSHTLIWISDTEKSCTWFNKTWLDFTGRSIDEESGAGWVQGVHPDDVERCLAIFNEAFDARRPFEMRYRLRRKDGEYRWIDDRGSPLFGENGIFEGYTGDCLEVADGT